jgi:hypothetical protein
MEFFAMYWSEVPHNTPSLKTGLSDEQVAAGVDKPLTTVRGVVTRWNGYWSAVQRNNRIMPYIQSALEAAGRVTVFRETEDGEVRDGEDGGTAELVEVEGHSLLPTMDERVIGRHFEAIAAAMFYATQKLQGLGCSADVTYLLVWRLHDYYANPPHEHTVKAPTTLGGCEAPGVVVRQEDLHSSVKKFQEIAATELHRRFIKSGP